MTIGKWMAVAVSLTCLILIILLSVGGLPAMPMWLILGLIGVTALAIVFGGSPTA